MGISGLFKTDLVQIEKCKIENLSGKIIIVDASFILNKYGIGIRSSGKDVCNKDNKIVNHIYTINYFTTSLLRMNILPLFVFDGKPNDLKFNTILNRKKKKLSAEIKLNDTDIQSNKNDYTKWFKKSYKITKENIDECKQLLDCMGLNYIQAPQEADSQCALIAKKYRKFISGVITDDSDILLYGCPYIFKNFNLKTNTTDVISYDKIINNFKKKSLDVNSNINFTDDEYYKKFIQFCCLFGSDYNKSIIKKNDVNVINNFINIYFLSNMNLKTTFQKLSEENKKCLEKKKMYKCSDKILENINTSYTIYTEPIAINYNIIELFPKKPNNINFYIFMTINLNFHIKQIMNTMNKLLNTYIYFTNLNPLLQSMC